MSKIDIRETCNKSNNIISQYRYIHPLTHKCPLNLKESRVSKLWRAGGMPLTSSASHDMNPAIKYNKESNLAIYFARLNRALNELMGQIYRSVITTLKNDLALRLHRSYRTPRLIQVVAFLCSHSCASRIETQQKDQKIAIGLDGSPELL